MEKLKVVHTLFSGLGGPGNVVFPLLTTQFGSLYENKLVFFGTSQVLDSYLKQSETLGIASHTIIKKPKRYRNAFKTFKNYLKKEQPNCIFIHSSELIIPAIRYRKSVKNCVIFYVEHENHVSKGRLLRFLSGYAGKKANGIVCLSKAYADRLLSRFPIKVPIHIIPNGVDTMKFSPVKEAIKTPILGMASRMIPGKDHVTLLNAFKNVLQTHPNAQLLIAGEGETLAKTKDLCESLDIQKQVTFLGLLNEDEMVDFYRSISIFALATKSENLSTALLQAMACELLIVTSNIDNNKILIQPEQTGWLYENEDEKSLTSQLLGAIEGLVTKNEIRKNARQCVIDNYSKEQMFEKYNALLSSKKSVK